LGQLLLTIWWLLVVVETILMVLVLAVLVDLELQVDLGFLVELVTQ
jgi:hypothetical protein